MKFVYSKRTTLAEYLAFWLDNYAKIGIRNSTYDTYYDIIYRHVVPNIGDIKFSKLKSEDMQKFLNNEAVSGNLRNGGKLAPKTIDNYKKMLSEAFEVAIDLDYISRNPLRRVVIERVITPEMAILSHEEEALVLSTCMTERYVNEGFAVYLALKFGMRNGEICALKWSDINFGTKSLKVCRTVHRQKNRSESAGTKTIITVGMTKTRKGERVLPFTDNVSAILLNEMRRRQNSDYYTKRNTRTDMRDYIFINKIGGFADTSTINEKFKKMLKEIGINNDKYHFHTLRHTFATRANEKNVNEKIVSYLLGHASVQFTLDRYTHVLPETARENMAIIQDG